MELCGLCTRYHCEFWNCGGFPRTFAVSVAQGRFNILKCHKMALSDSEALVPPGPAMAAGQENGKKGEPQV
ncbi:hypothetical protein HGM15179_001758 [Zosterops borbonicus]|uniref:Uncharacterized protein n=1 Tax=Zosterops borbonicus TaxID=364589 RepID=A0A8K1GU57_9PASS|nr:hypothetical protein HGM15179_001758 [Zosterops borbonicus]